MNSEGGEATRASPHKVLTTADLIFPQTSASVSKTLKNLSKHSLSLSNRFYSIAADAEFVRHVAAVLDLPVVANERCGSWYVQPELKAGSAYFKSTDGHWGQWRFSLRRLNLEVLEIIAASHG